LTLIYTIPDPPSWSGQPPGLITMVLSSEAAFTFAFLSQGQSFVLARLVPQVPSIQEHRFVYSRGKLCRYYMLLCAPISISFNSTINSKHFYYYCASSFSSIPGHYIPQLAKLMIEVNKKEKLFNLKGIAVRTLTSHLCDKEIVTFFQNWTSWKVLTIEPIK